MYKRQAHGRAAQPPATAAHGRDPPRARDDHRRGIDPVRLQVDAAAGRGRPDPDRLPAQRRLRGHPRAARAAERARDVLGARRLRLLQPPDRHRHRACTRVRSATSGGGGVHAPPPRILRAPVGALYQDHERPRGGGGPGSSAPSLRHRPHAGRDLLQPAFDRVRQRHPLRAAAALEPAARGPGHRAHAGPDQGQPPPDRAMGAAAAGQRVQERDPRHRRARLEKSAGRDPRPHRDPEGDDRHGGRARRQCPGAARPHPRRR